MRRPTLALLAAAALGLAGCHKPAAKAEPAHARTVTVVRIQPRAIVGALAASGDLVARQEAAEIGRASCRERV